MNELRSACHNAIIKYIPKGDTQVAVCGGCMAEVALPPLNPEVES